MPTYTVICSHKSNGTDQALLIHANDALDAQDRVQTAGYLVSKVFLAIPDQPTQQPLPPPQLVMDAFNNVKRIEKSGILWSPIGTIATGVLIGVLLALLITSCLGFGISEALKSAGPHNTYGR
ncbi:MAG: hypothetical protein QM783_06555 [Phycisphaerales bacterium]